MQPRWACSTRRSWNWDIWRIVQTFPKKIELEHSGFSDLGVRLGGLLTSDVSSPQLLNGPNQMNQTGDPKWHRLKWAIFEISPWQYRYCLIP